jgi:cell wall-associated NlpC family hydrolase
VDLIDLAPYVGIPYRSHGRGRDGCDCWGLVMLFYREQYGIELQGFSEAYADAGDQARVSSLLQIGRRFWEPVAEPFTGDLYLIRIGRWFSHVGIVLSDGEFLHALKGRNSAVERADSLIWRNCIAGGFRFVER